MDAAFKKNLNTKATMLKRHGHVPISHKIGIHQPYYIFVYFNQGDTHAIHKKFMGECHKRLELLLSQLKENEDCSPKEGKITRTFRKPHPVKGSSVER